MTFVLLYVSPGVFDFIHLHWPESQIASSSFLVSLALQMKFYLVLSFAKLRGAKIVWTVHNLQPHSASSKPALQLFGCWFPRLVSGTISLSSIAQKQLFVEHPRLSSKPHAIIYHGHYRTIYPTPMVRRSAGLDVLSGTKSRTIGFFGTIKPYKQIDHLLEEFARLRTPDVCLSIVGFCSDQYLTALIESHQRLDSRIGFINRLVADHEIPQYVSRFDLGVLPFSRILNSGSVLLLLSLGVPVLAPKLGSLVEIQRIVGNNWLQLYEGTLRSEDLTCALDSVEHLDTNGPDLSEFSWDLIGKSTADFFRELR